MLKRIFGASAGPAPGLWPRSALVATLKARFTVVDDLGEEDRFALYGVTDGEVRFVAALHLAEGAPDRVSDVGFIARFSGYSVSAAALEQANRLLHVSVLAEELGDIYLLCAFEATGVFKPETFALLIEAWRRDLLVTLHALAGGSLAAAFPLSRSAVAMRFATNAASEARSAPALFAAFAAAAGRDTAVCAACAGRGRTGLIARQCADCGGAGFVARSGVMAGR